MALRLRADSRGGLVATVGRSRPGRLVLVLVVVGVALIVFGSEWLPAVLGGILTILVAAFLAMRASR